MKVLFVASECAPFAKVGGLADVIGSLSKELVKLGLDLRIIIPKYEIINEKDWNLKFVLDFEIDKEKVLLWEAFLPKSKVLVYFLENQNYLTPGEIYPSMNEFRGVAKFLFFSKAVLRIFELINWWPEIIHVHEWESAILPPLIKVFRMEIKTVLTLHNLSAQGKWSAQEVFEFLNLKGDEIESFKIRDKENNFNILQQGILNADILTTVSPRYKKEILKKEFGEGLEEDLKKRKKVFFGILNGIDTEFFNPETDPNLKVNYSKKDFEKKIENKFELQKILGFERKKEIPLMGFIGRLVYQKGIDLFEEIIFDLVKLNCQVVFLGVGEEKYEKMLFDFSKKYPKNISVNLRFDPILAQKIYGGTDIILIPSLFEPCGLVQMIAQRYGTIPVARKVGGLADTVEDGKTGFLFKDFNKNSFLKAIERAIFSFKNEKKWKLMIKKAMEKDFSWEKSAKEYFKIYQKLVGK